MSGRPGSGLVPKDIRTKQRGFIVDMALRGPFSRLAYILRAGGVSLHSSLLEPHPGAQGWPGLRSRVGSLRAPLAGH